MEDPTKLIMQTFLILKYFWHVNLTLDAIWYKNIQKEMQFYVERIPNPWDFIVNNENINCNKSSDMLKVHFSPPEIWYYWYEGSFIMIELKTIP